MLVSNHSLILQKLTYSELEKACEYDTFTQNICNTDNFWRSHLLKHYNVDGKNAIAMLEFWGFKSLKELDKYLFDYGKDAKRVVQMYLYEFIDEILNACLNNKFYVQKDDSGYEIFLGISRQMRRTIPQLVLTKTNFYLIFFYSDIQSSFGNVFITIEEGNEWIYVEPFYVNKEVLERYGGPIYTRKQDVKPGEDYRGYYVNHIKLAEKTQRIWEKYATSKWPKLLE